MDNKNCSNVVSETLKLARSLGQVYKITFKIPVNEINAKKSSCSVVDKNQSAESSGSNNLNHQTTNGIKRPREITSYDNEVRNKIQKVQESSATKQLGEIIHVPKSIIITVNTKTSDLSFVLVIDFESTCWKKMPFIKTPVEIIEFPAVLMNLNTGVIEDQFQQFIMPIEQPRLSDFCTKLTGITQAQVDGGVPLKNAISRFVNWLETVSLEKNLVPMDSPLQGKKYAIVTWSDWDLSVCLKQECLRKGLRIPAILKKWVDLRAVYRQWYGRPPCGLKGSMEEVGLTFEGREHSGLIDSQNTARLAFKMVTEGALLSYSNIVNK